MCGIVGYVGKGNNAGDIIHGGLKSLEYRGYDSCGIALTNKGWDQLRVFKTIGPPSDLKVIKYSSGCGIVTLGGLLMEKSTLKTPTHITAKIMKFT